MSDQQVEVEIGRLGNTSRAIVWISAVLFVAVLLITGA